MADVKTLVQESAARNRDLLKTLAQTDHAAPALEQHKRFLKGLKNDLENSTHRRANYDRSRKAELKDHEDYTNSHFRKFLFRATGNSGKFQERASKEEREYFEALQKFHEEEKINASLAARVAEAERVLEELEAVAKVNTETQRQLDDLYFAIFSGPTPQFPGDDERESKSNQALQVYHNTRVKSEAESQVVQLLTTAAMSMRKSLDAMEDALSASRMDMFGGGTMADFMERNALSQAERYVHDAQIRVMQAQQVSPAVGGFPRVRFVQQSFVGDILFDNIFSDMAMHEKLKDGKMEFQMASVWVHDQLQAAKERQRMATEELRGRQDDLESARRDLQRFREGVFERVANGELPQYSR